MADQTTVVEVTETARGTAGLSAYQVAVANGFVGTEAEWLDSLSDTAAIDAETAARIAADNVLQGNINGKEPAIAPGTIADYWRGDKTWQALNKAAVGLANVDNTSDANKPISVAAAAALAGKEPSIAPSGNVGDYWAGNKTWQPLPAPGGSNLAAVPEDFGAVGDNVADDGPELQAWLDAGGFIHLPGGAKCYFTAQDLILRKPVFWTGEPLGFDPREATYADMLGSKIRFAGGKGFKIQGNVIETDVATVLADLAGHIVQDGAANSYISNIALLGGGGAAVAGWFARCPVVAENIQVIGFSGDGFDIAGTSDIPDGAGTPYGNVNTSKYHNCRADGNGGDGFSIRGRDANACEITGLNVTGNGGFGIHDESLLGNNYHGFHIDGNTGGAIKANGAVQSGTLSGYLEGSFNTACQISAHWTIYGLNLEGVNTPPDTKPGQFTGSNTIVSSLKINWQTGVLTALAGSDYGRFGATAAWGLGIQGKGGTGDVTLVNQSGTVAAYVNANTTNFTVVGKLTADYLDITNAGTVEGRIDVSGGLVLDGDQHIFRKMDGTSVALLNLTGLAVTGTVTGSNLSGTNTGNETSASIVAALNTNALPLLKLAAATGAGFVGASAAGNFSEITGTQATALLDVFSASAKGLAPVSPGGTSAFLRADGTWAVPGGSGAPGGADRQLQFNNAGAFEGAAHVDIDAQGDLRLETSGTPVTPPVDHTAFHPCRIAPSGGRVWSRMRGEDGVSITMASHQGRNTIAYAQAIGSATTALAFAGVAALTAVGTATSRVVATTNRLTRAKRLGYVSAATAGAAAGLSNQNASNTQWSVGGAAGAGFLLIWRFAVSDVSLVAGAHSIIGVRNAITAPAVATNPNTLTNIIALAQLNGGTNWHIVYGGSAAQTPIDTGMAVNNTDLLELTLYARPDDATKVAWRLENITTAVVANGVLTAAVAGTQLPAVTTLLGPLCWRSNNATAAAVGIDIASFYLESDI